MEKRISYRNDVFFKYAFGQNNNHSIRLRKWLINDLLGKNYENLKVENPEIIPEQVDDKRIVLDLIIENDEIIINIEMQNSTLNQYQYKRFQFYHSRLMTRQLQKGDDYTKLKDIYQIIFINDINENHPQLMMSYHLKGEEMNSLESYLVHIIFIYIPYIDKVIEKKKVLNTFEAMICLFHRQTLEGVEYEDKGGIICMLEEQYKNFVKEPELSRKAWYREVHTIDYDAMKRIEIEEAKEKATRIAIKEGRRQGKEEGIELTRLHDIQSVMVNFNLDCDSAMNALNIVQDERQKYRNMIKNSVKV